MPVCGRLTQCQKHRMSCSNPYTLACIWTVVSTFTSFLLKAPRQLPVPENEAFKFPHLQPEQGACCGNQHCRVQPVPNTSSSVTFLMIFSVHLVIQVYPTLPPCSSLYELSDRFLPYLLSPWRPLLKAQHRCFTHCKHCLAVSHFMV